MIRLLLLLSVLTSGAVQAQSSKKIIYGANLGVKFANKNYAVRYTGVYQNQLENFFSIPQNYQTVRQLLGNYDFYLSEISNLYRYQPAIVFGVMTGYQASPNLSFDMDLNVSTLQANTGYTLTVINPGNQTSQDEFVTGFITGKESRFNGRINMNYNFAPEEKTAFIMGLSGIFVAWRMEENLVELNGSILTNLYSQFNPNNDFSVKVSGNGFGFGLNTGIAHKFSEKNNPPVDVSALCYST